MASEKESREQPLAFENASTGPRKLSAGDDLLSGESLATPRMRVEQELLTLVNPAGTALRRILKADPHTYENLASSNFAKVQFTAAVYALDSVKGLVAENGKQTKKAAQILAAVGGDAINRELMRRYAQKQRTSERQRIVQAVDATPSDTVKGESLGIDRDSNVSQETQVRDTTEDTGG